MKVFLRLCRMGRIVSVLFYYHVIAVHWLGRGKSFRISLEKLGPIFIKAGQILSTRRDILPADVAAELEKLQDQVAPFSGDTAEAMVVQALGGPLDRFFRTFEKEALASASVAQVHAAERHDGRRVVVKILRPGIQRAVKKDIDLLFMLASLLERFRPALSRFKPHEVVAEIETTLLDELDLQREAANASQLRRNFQGTDILYIPEIDWQLSRPDMLVMERIEGIPIHQRQLLQDSGYHMEKLAAGMVEVFFTQVFRDSFFHADMHPGNIFVRLGNFDSPRLCFVDFGITGSLNAKDQRYLADNLLAFFKRNYQRVAELHVASGWVPPDTRTDRFEGDMRAVCEPMFERPAAEISFGELLMRLFQTARRYQINIQPQLLLLQKTLLNVEGVARQLHPDLDLWKTAAPFLERWMKKQMGVSAFLRRLRENLPYWAEKLPEIPGLVYELLDRVLDETENRRFRRRENKT